MPKQKKELYKVANGEEVDRWALHQVKYTKNGKTCYGSVDTFRDEAKKLAKKGLAIVNDAIRPVYDVVPFSDLTPIPMGQSYIFGEGHWGDEYTKFVASEFKKAQALSDSLPDGAHVGKLFGVGVADGTAWYVIVKVNKSSVKVEWRAFCPDNYMDQVLGNGGTFPKRSIAPLCRSFNKMAMR